MVLTGAPQVIPEHLCLDLVLEYGRSDVHRQSTVKTPGPCVQVLFEGHL